MMTITRVGALTACIAAIALAGSCSLEQVLIGQWYTFQTAPVGNCPALGWHFVVDAKRSIGGYLARDQFIQIATLSGVLNPDDTFQMTATEVGGSRREDITGAFTAQYDTLSLDGSWICGKQTFRIRPLRGFGGGGGGGG
jgi:hypothetical protein